MDNSDHQNETSYQQFCKELVLLQNEASQVRDYLEKEVKLQDVDYPNRLFNIEAEVYQFGEMLKEMPDLDSTLTKWSDPVFKLLEQINNFISKNEIMLRRYHIDSFTIDLWRISITFRIDRSEGY